MKTNRRNCYLYMMKEGKFRALRNLPVGWVLQILHSTDRTERFFRIVLELTLVSFLFTIFIRVGIIDSRPLALLFCVLIVHTLSWLFIGNFWVYTLDSFDWIKNPGITKTFKFMLFCRRIFSFVDCCNAVLVYGSMSRFMFHDRSDLDLRVIRRVDSPLGYIAIFIGFLVRFYSFFLFQPVDLQVVDSSQFLEIQMRSDELPIKIYLRKGFKLVVNETSFESIKNKPSLVMKPTEQRFEF